MARASKARIAGMLGIAVVAGAAAVWAVAASADGYYSDGYRYGRGYPRGDPGLRLDLTRLREQMRTQQRQLQEQIRLQEEQIRLLRQQVSGQHQITAMQACYYRLGAGMETCRDLFGPGSSEFAACHEKVAERNSGCSLESPRAKAQSGG